MSSTLFPPANRQAAKIAFIRTFWQAVTGSTVVIGGSGFVLSAAGLANLDWAALGYGVGAIALTGLIAAGKSAGNILVNGLPNAYLPSAIDQESGE
ncbi:hypothetical protein ASE16_03465 [Leifsonia sp. Root227]|uniref:hypothetical protein n=1 Tax=Leifsonia sp. Root227 TaxID=1736496 RepID=UPI0006F244E6|nr:hypothetical protein [Leifsonia sp. Root227]KRC52119.1 hypothetical protein ASE16_03465 [Leifsonia sp. Root227]